MTNFFECDKIINIELNVKIKWWRESKVSIDVVANNISVRPYITFYLLLFICENGEREGGYWSRKKHTVFN